MSGNIVPGGVGGSGSGQINASFEIMILKNDFILNLTVLILFLLTKVKNDISLLQCSLNCCIQTIKGPVPQYQLNEFAFLYKYAFKMTLTL